MRFGLLGTIVEVSLEEAGGREFVTLVLAVESLEPNHLGLKDELPFQRRVREGDDTLEAGMKLRIASEASGDPVVYPILELVRL